jgi:hypothetical protein
MGLIQKVIDNYRDFATDGGTAHDNGSKVLLWGAVLILALGLYAVYNLSVAFLNGIRKTVVGTGRGVVRVGRMVGHKPEAAVAVTAAIPTPRTAVAVGTGRPIPRKRETAKIG